MPIEYEIKLRDTREALCGALQRIGAQPRGERTLQDDLVLDTPERSILGGGGLLRLRNCGGRFLLTLKGHAEEDGPVKAKSEVETWVSDGAAVLALFEELGFSIAVRYQKYRTAFTCPVEGCESVDLTLDETPLGDFLEIEGDPAQIHRVAVALGYSRAGYETRSYLEIHRDEGGEGDMTFDDRAHVAWGSAATAASAGRPGGS